MGRRKAIKPYDLPDSLLAQLSEHTHNGFILFCLDNMENSRSYCSFDSVSAMKALKSDVVNWANAMQHIETQSTLHGILGHDGSDEDVD
jgi:hypothetical protein